MWLVANLYCSYYDFKKKLCAAKLIVDKSTNLEITQL